MGRGRTLSLMPSKVTCNFCKTNFETESFGDNIDEED